MRFGTVERLAEVDSDAEDVVVVVRKRWVCQASSRDPPEQT